MDREVAKGKLEEKTTKMQTLKHDFEGMSWRRQMLGLMTKRGSLTA